MAQNLLLIQKEYLQKVWVRPLFPLPRIALYPPTQKTTAYGRG
jgi:hypothetical protein